MSSSRNAPAFTVPNRLLSLGDIWDYESDYYFHNRLATLSDYLKEFSATLLHNGWWRAPVEFFEERLRNPDAAIAPGMEDRYFEVRYNSKSMTSFDELIEECPSVYSPKQTLISRKTSNVSGNVEIINTSLTEPPTAAPPPAPPVVNPPTQISNPIDSNPFQVASHRLGERVFKAIRNLTMKKQLQSSLTSSDEVPVEQNSGLPSPMIHMFDYRLSPYANRSIPADCDAVMHVLKTSEVRRTYDSRLFCLAVPSHLAFNKQNSIGDKSDAIQNYVDSTKEASKFDMSNADRFPDILLEDRLAEYSEFFRDRGKEYPQEDTFLLTQYCEEGIR
eukprot:TRINITY_DN6639_c0_g1_i1.p1 TRINITY_DN6639_c0_g1~~TRINITY_DN6639_c0_g1_i1.p1  ORF type:complete len:332 (+),score=72.18 TRINITY_DN6639_c0_g1_i1:995-1990(+)